MTLIITGGSVAPDGDYRTTEEAVRALGAFPASVSLVAAVETANCVVDDLVAWTTLTISDKKLELIERWLAAHYAAVTNPSVSSKSVMGASESYNRGGLDKGLNFTEFGMQAIRLDPSGYLESLDQQTPSVMWLGTE